MADRPQPTLREPLGVFALVVVCLALLTTAAHVIPPLQGHTAALAALLFILVPYVLLRRRGEDLADFGIALERFPLSHIGLGLAAAILVFIPFALGNHLWEAHVTERQFHPSPDHYFQWPEELSGAASSVEAPRYVRVRERGSTLSIDAASPDGPIHALVQADRPFRWDDHGTLRTIPAPPEWLEDPTSIPLADLPPGMNTLADAWLITLPNDRHQGQLRLRGPPGAPPEELPRSVKIQVLHDGDAALYFGDQPTHEEGAPTGSIDRTLWWLLLWGLTHLIVIAFPEEYFYRGYLQTRLHQRFGTDPNEKPGRFLGFSKANWITSALFAVGHVLVPIAGTIDPARAAVFFPSLLFGWLKDRTGSIVAPTILHGLANMMILVLHVHYF